MTKPLLSIVSGTYQRLPSLSRMITSARQLSRHIPVEFIIVDGGSTDGTVEWCSRKPDIRLIEQGKLLGAIKAFCAGAEASEAEYVLFANDDIAFQENSILAALRHLMTHPTCGAVAFADNRSAQIYGNVTGHRVEGIGAIDPDGNRCMVHYAQVGLFRRWLGELCGWWGSKDPIMQNARTYGGDSFLSARIWEMGYSVHAVEGAAVDDYIVRDDLRLWNGAHGPQDSTAYYTRYPDGPRIPATPQMVNPQTEPMRILYLPIYTREHPAKRQLEYGLPEAMSQYGLVYEFDYLNTRDDLIAVVKAWQPHLMLTQIQGVGERFTIQHIQASRAACPGMVCVNTNGDAHEEGLIGAGIIDLLKHFDLQLTVNAKVLPEYNRIGIKAAFWEINYKDPATEVPIMPSHDILYPANWYEYRIPLFNALKEMQKIGMDVGLYGNVEGANGNTHGNFAAMAALYRNCKIAIGDTFPNTVGFVSNRVFQALSQGAFLLQQHSPDLEKWTGLKAGVHYAEWKEINELPHLISQWLLKDEERRQIAEAGKEYVRPNFSSDAQIRKLFEELLPRIA